MKNALRRFRQVLPPINFITLHYAYFIAVCIISAVVFWGSSTPARSVTFTDSLFLCVSAMTLAGLNTVNLSTLNTFQQFILFLLIMMGSAVLVSAFVVHVRTTAFEKRFQRIVKKERERKNNLRALISRIPLPLAQLKTGASQLPEPEVDGIVVRGRVIPANESTEEEAKKRDTAEDGTNGDREILAAVEEVRERDEGESRKELDTKRTENAIERESRAVATTPGTAAEADAQLNRSRRRPAPLRNPESHLTGSQIRFAEPSPMRPKLRRRTFTMSGVGARQDILNHPRLAPANSYLIPLATPVNENDHVRDGPSKYFHALGGFIGRNSQFFGLSLAERDRLGGVEYRGLMIIEAVVLAYFTLLQLLGCIALGAWVALNMPDTALQNGLNPWYILPHAIRNE